MAPILRNVSRVRVFEPRKSGALFPSEPVVGGKAIVLGEDSKRLVGLDRETLAVTWRAQVSGLGPVRWWDDDLLVLRGETDIGAWDVPGRRLLWRVKGELGLGGNRSDGSILAWKTKNEIEVREIKGGQVTSTIRLTPPPVRFATVCDDTLVCQSVETGDPIRAIRLDDGVGVWDRNLLHEMRLTYGIDDPYSVSIVAGSIPGQFVALRGSAAFGCSLKDGGILWKADVRVPYYWPLVERGRIPVYSDPDARFVVIDEATGELVCDRRYPELRPMYRVKRGSILGDFVIFVSESGHVAAFRLDTGDLAYLEQHKRVAFWGTAVADGRLLVSGSDGNLWVYEGAGRTD